MNKKKDKLPEPKRGGMIDTPLDKTNQIPIHTPGGQIKTNWANIRWTKKKVTFVSLFLGTPYVIALVVSWVAINRFITYVLVGLALLFGLIVLLLRLLDRDEF